MVNTHQSHGHAPAQGQPEKQHSLQCLLTGHQEGPGPLGLSEYVLWPLATRRLPRTHMKSKESISTNFSNPYQ